VTALFLTTCMFAPAYAFAADKSPALQANAASEDHDAPLAGPVKEPPFYNPTAQELSLAPPPPSTPFMLSLLADGHGFTSGGGFGAVETRLRFGKPSVGVTVGLFDFKVGELGVDFLRYMGFRVAAKSASFPFDTYVLFPNIDVRGYFDGGSRVGTVFGTSLSGLRIANCSLTGCTEVSLRVLTADLWYDFNSPSQNFAVSLGAGASAGIKLW
jgi:hypothetical protein